MNSSALATSPAVVHLLNISRWPRYAASNSSAYRRWSPTLRHRVEAAFGEDGVDASTTHRGSDALASDVCLYHPFVNRSEQDEATAQLAKYETLRGSQADFFSRDGFWYL